MLDFDQFCSKIHQKLKNRENLQVKKSSEKIEKSKNFKNFEIFRDEKQSETARNTSKHHADQHNRPESKNQDLSKRMIFLKKWSFGGLQFRVPTHVYFEHFLKFSRPALPAGRKSGMF